MRSILNTQTGHRRLAAVAVVAFMHFVIPDAASAEGPAIELSTGFDYSSGHYGTGVDTDILFIPVTGRYETGSASGPCSGGLKEAVEGFQAGVAVG
jgi:hypothetical protein